MEMFHLRFEPCFGHRHATFYLYSTRRYLTKARKHKEKCHVHSNKR